MTHTRHRPQPAFTLLPMLLLALPLAACGGDGEQQVMLDQNGQIVRVPVGPQQQTPSTAFTPAQVQTLVQQVQSGQLRLEDLTPDERRMLYAASNPRRGRR